MIHGSDRGKRGQMWAGLALPSDALPRTGSHASGKVSGSQRVQPGAANAPASPASDRLARTLRRYRSAMPLRLPWHRTCLTPIWLAATRHPRSVVTAERCSSPC